jgi:hypothetical protein
MTRLVGSEMCIRDSLYAARLADQAGQGGAAAKYRAAAPTDGEWFDAGISSINLTCWNVTVSK